MSGCFSNTGEGNKCVVELQFGSEVKYLRFILDSKLTSDRTLKVGKTKLKVTCGVP